MLIKLCNIQVKGTCFSLEYMFLWRKCI